VLIFITLLAGFVPLLQVTFFVLLEDLYPGRLAVKDRDKTPRITGVILIMPSRQMQDLVKLELTSGCQDDRGTVDETTIRDLCEYHVM
jgi:hypothetical protein